MELQDLAITVSSTLLIGRLAADGIRRRRGIWTRTSWKTFALVLSVSVICLGISLIMAALVDVGIYEGMPLVRRRAYFWTMVGFMAVGVLSLVMPMMWFARGRPDRQLSPRDFLRPFMFD